MVYNAMKLFMEINPAVFDDCSMTTTNCRTVRTSAVGEARFAHWASVLAAASHSLTSRLIRGAIAVECVKFVIYWRVFL